MERDEWQADNPDPIVVNSNVLLNGQHRLAAIIESGKAQRMWIWRGAPSSVMDTMDTGLSRTFTDKLKLEGEQYPSLLAGVLRQLWLYKEEGVLGGKANESPSNAELMEILRREPKIREAVALVAKDTFQKKEKSIGDSSLVTAAYWIFSKQDPDDALDFLRRLLTGVDLAEGDPILALRRIMLMSRRKPRPRVMGALMIKTWNFWRAGESIKVLQWRTNQEQFPEVN